MAVPAGVTQPRAGYWPRKMNMNMQGRALFTCLVVALGLAREGIVAEAPNSQPERIQTWQRWEHILTSAHNYANPYADIILRVTYTGPGDHRLHTYGFWDGAGAFRIRCAFPAPGTWHWQTECWLDRQSAH